MSIFNYYRPKVGGSFLLALITLAGNLLASLAIGLTFFIQNGKMPMPEDLLSMNMLMMYLVAFVPVAIFIFLRSSYLAKSAVRDSMLTGGSTTGSAADSSAGSAADNAPLAIDAPKFGSLGVMKTTVSVAILTFLLIFVMDPLESILPESSTLKYIFKAMNEQPLWAALSTCIAAPICEELLCRGFMLRGMLKAVKPWQAIVLSAFLFAVIHGNISQGVVAFIIGALLGWVYYRTGSILLAMMVHFIVNGTSTMVALCASDPEAIKSIHTSMSECNPIFYWLLFAAAIAAGYAIINYLHKSLPASDSTEACNTELK